MATVIYFHGFASTGTGPKVDALKSAFPNDVVLAPDLPSDPVDVILTINSIIDKVKNYPLIFVGTSLGGFWANYFGQVYDVPAVLVNPSTRPSQTLAQRVNTEVVNYHTGDIIKITAKDIDRFKSLESTIESLYNGALVHLFVAEDDNVINPAVTLENIKYTKFKSVTPDGGHRYSEKWNDVISHMQAILK